MNVWGIANQYTQAVNPNVAVTIRIGSGYTTASDGSRSPTFDTVTGVPAQIQALTYQDIQFLDGLQINGERRSVYLYGRYDSLNRGAGTGGDLITFPDGTVWLAAYVFEVWPDWCRLAVTLQDE